MLHRIKVFACGLSAVVSIGTAFMVVPTITAQASNTLVSKVPVKIDGNWYSNADHMGKYGRKKTVTLRFTKKHADIRVWNTTNLTDKQQEARQHLSKRALRLVTKRPNRSQFMLGHVGPSLWNKYYMTKSKNGKIKYVTDHYWITAPIIHGIGTNYRMYTWTTTSTRKFNTQPLHGKHAVVSWSKVKKHGTWYTKTP